jgi:ABC-type nitrate/sulfonate/bicarbonate transport system substrate-binding protein
LRLAAGTCSRLISIFWAAILIVGYFLGAVVVAQIPSIKPEKNQLEVAIAAWGATSIPTAVALDGGYFAKHGLAVNISVVAASTSVQALISGRVDIYQGGATAIAGISAGRTLFTLVLLSIKAR